MNQRFSKLITWLIPLVLVSAIFLFFQFCYPYHLFRREQTMIFLMDAGWIGDHLSRVGGIADLVGDFFTQFFYFVGLGPAIISLWLGVLWLTVWCDVKQFVSNALVRVSIPTLITAWEFLRECSENYSLGTTVALIAAFALLLLVLKVRNKIANPIVAVAAIALCYWCFGYSWVILAALLAVCSAFRRLWATMAIALVALAFIPKSGLKQVVWWGWPNFVQEHKLAIDSEVYFGNLEKALSLTIDGPNTRYSMFYYYLLNALKGNLPDAVSMRMPKDANSLLPTMDPTKNSLDLSALGEAWYYMGDMTSAEHCTIVAMISTTRYTGSRYLKRLAEINLAKGDVEAAMKYLRLLSKTLCHSRWAKSRMPGHESEVAKANRDDVSRFIVDADTLRFVNDYTLTLRHLVKGAPDNYMAYDFLQCHNLLRRDLKAFIEDFDQSRPFPRLYQEAMLAYLSIINASPEQLDEYDIPESTIEDFFNFNQMLPITDSNQSKVASRYGNTFWFFYQLPQK